MRFKASLTIPFKIADIRLPADTTLEFTKSQIIFPKSLNNGHYANSYIKNGVHYDLIIHDEIDMRLKYEIRVGNKKLIRVAINRKNEKKLKWVHKLYWIQKPDSNWFKQALLAGTISIVGYFIGQHIGIKEGYQDGLKKAQEEFKKSHRPK